MATDTIYIYDLRNQRVYATTDVVVLANSNGVTDAGQFVIYEQEVSPVLSRATLGSVAILMTKNNSCLTIGGDYNDESGSSAYNIYVNSNVTKNNPSFVGTKTATTISAVQFTQNGTLVLASQAGNVMAYQDVYDTGAEKDDDHMQIAASRTLETSYEKWNISTLSHGPLPTEANVYTFLADGTLTVNGSLVGTITASNTVNFNGGKSIGTDSKVTYVDNVSSTNLNSIVFKADSLVLEGNIEKALSATMTATLETVAAPKADSNTITAAVFAADSFQMASGLWAGSATASANEIEIDALYKELMGTSGTAASAGGNTIIAKVVDAETIQICEIGSGTDLNAGVLKAQVKDVTIEAESSSESADVSTSVSNNLIEAVVFDGSTIQIDCLNADANLTAELSDITLKASRSGGKTYTENMIGNAISAVAIRGDEVTIGDLYGSINVSTNGLELDGKNRSYTLETDNNTTTVAGILTGYLHVTGTMAGQINIKTNDGSFIGANSTYQQDYTLAAIHVDGTITVDGRIDTDISTTTGFGIETHKLNADAFTGTITSGYTGIITGALATAVKGDSFDIAGDITAADGIVAGGEVNLRVSGTVYCTAKAIRTSDSHDEVTLASTAKVTGNIDLNQGENLLILNSNAQLDGSMLASEGTLQVKFILEGEQEKDSDGNILRAVVEGAEKTDFTLNSGSELLINLNYAEDGQTYELIHYGVEADEYWYGESAKHKITFLYHGQTLTGMLNSDNRTVSVEFTNTDGTKAKASLYYDEDENTVIVNEISGIEKRGQFTAVDLENTKYDAATKTATIAWDTTQTFENLTASAYELEYTVYRGSEKCGESILVHISDLTQSSYVIRNLDEDQSVQCRMRLVGSNSDDSTSWSNSFNVSGQGVTVNTPSFAGKTTTVTNTTDSSSTSLIAIGTFAWEAPDSDRPMESYTLEVYETNEIILLEDDEKDKKSYQEKVLDVLEQKSNEGLVYRKTVTNTQTVVSGLNGTTYLYWRVKGEDVDGNSTSWLVGEATESYGNWLPGLVDDTTAPEFVKTEDPSSVSVTVTEDASGSKGFAVTITWCKAEDDAYAVRNYVVEYTLSSNLSWDKSVADVISTPVYAKNEELNDPDYTYTYSFNADCGEYIYRIQAVDYFGNKSAYIGNESFGDGVAPEFVGEEFSTAVVDQTYIVEGEVYYDLCFTWNIASDGENISASEVATGVKEYVLEYTLTGGDKQTKTFTAAEVEDPTSQQCSASVTNVKAGQYTYRIYAVDYAGNASDAIEAEIKGDATAPIFNEVENAVSVETEYSGSLLCEETEAVYNLTFTWNAATDERGSESEVVTGVKEYVLQYTLNDLAWDSEETKTIHLAVDDVENPETLLCSYGVTDVTPGYYKYRIQAVDYAGNESEYIGNETFGDGTAPAFKTGTSQTDIDVYVDRSEAGQVYYNLVFGWNAAIESGSGDDGSATGIKKYVLEYTLQDDTEWTDKKSLDLTLEDGIGLGLTDYDYCYTINHEDAGLYMYRIQAVDYADNASGYIEGTFGSSDVVAPSGNFVTIGTPVISVTYEEVEEEEDDDMDLVYQTDEEEPTYIIDDASVVFSWTDTYTDDSGVYYKIQFSDSESFTSDKTYTFQTRTAGEKSYTLGNDLPTEPVGILATMSKVYWRVMAVDGNGNETGYYSDIQSFVFKDDDDNKVTHLSAPDQPTDLTVSDQTMEDGVHTGALKLSWQSNHTDLGILYYDIIYSSKDSGDNFTYKLTSLDTVSGSGDASTITLSYDAGVLKDGTYTWQVKAYNAAGAVTASAKSKFIQDTTRPDTVVGLTAKSWTKDVALTWDESYDKFGIEEYEVRYRVKGTTAWSNALTTDDASYDLCSLAEGEYEYTVTAYDKNGNIGLVSDIGTFTVDSSDDLYDSYVPLLWKSYEEAAGETGIQQDVGISDDADYFYINRDDTFSLTVNVSELETVMGKNSGIKIALYKYDGTGNEKAITTVDVTKAKDGVINGKMLDAGIYYFKVTSKNENAKENYTLSLVTDLLEDGDLEIDNTPADAMAIATREEQPAYLSTTQAVPAEGTEWVGPEDLIDYRLIKLDYSGKYNFTIADVDKNTQLVMTIWQEKENKKGTYYTAVKKITVKGKDEASISGLLLDNANTYFISVAATYGKKGQTSTYTLTMGGDEFTEANQYVDGTADDADTLAADDIYLSMQQQEVADEWVGYSDLIDYRKIQLEYSGNYDFNLNGLESDSQVALTLWQKKSNGKLTAVKKVTVSKKTSASMLGILLDDSNEYYISVESKNGNKGLGTGYTLVMSGDEFIHANLEDDDTAAKAAILAQQTNVYLSMDMSVEDEWVGYEDLIDYRQIVLDYSGKYTFNLTAADASTPLTLTVWQEKSNGKLAALKKITVTGTDKGKGAIKDLLLDQAGTYYVSVESKNGKKGKSSDYDLTMTGEEFKKVNNKDDDWQELSDVYTLGAGESITGEWVGYTDLKDYRKLEISESGTYELSLNDLTMSTPLTLTVWKEKNGKLVSVKKLAVSNKTEAVLSNLKLDAAEQYYVSMESKNGKSGKNSGYTLSLSGDWTPSVNNADDDWSSVLGEYSRFDNSTTLQDWVGTDDTEDWFKLEIAEDGTFDVQLDLGSQAEVSLYKSNGTSLTPISGEGTLDLTAGIYALSVNTEASSVSYKLEFDEEKKVITATLA